MSILLHATMQSSSDTQQNKNNDLLNVLQNVQSQEDAIDKIGSLLSEGAIIDTVNSDSNTILHISVTKKYGEIVKYLLGRGAKINLKNKDDKTACDLAVGDLNLTRILIASVNVPNDGNGLFCAAALAYLTPSRNDDNSLQQRAIKLFGEDNVDGYMQSLLGFIKDYNPFANSYLVNNDTVKNLITERFRSRVVQHMRSNQSQFSPYVETNDDSTFQNYLRRLEIPGSWGGELELTAISEMLQCTVVVKSIALPDAPVTYEGNGTSSDRIVLFHIGSQTESLPSQPNIGNHYEFAVDLNIVDGYIREEITPASPTIGKTMPPYAEQLEVDAKLHLSCDMFHNRLHVDHTQKLTSTPTFPTPKTLAQFAINVYNVETAENVGLPVGWELLTTATNTELANGYHGAAYWNPKTCQVVIAHRGTPPKQWVCPRNWGPIGTDILGIVLNIAMPQMHSACTFAETICAVLKKFGDDHEMHFQLFFTGHSLGGWLAQITAFSAKYLKMKGTLFQKLKNTSQLKGFHAHTVVFDSPGCKDALTNLKTTYDVRYDGRSISLRSLDITSYLSAPNLINTRNEHVGTLYRVFVDVTEIVKPPKWSVISYLKQLLNIPEGITKYTLVTHDKKNILQALDCVDGYGKPKIVTVIDWPVSCLFSSSSEYLDFHEWATNLNKYHPDPEAKEFKKEVSNKSGYFPIRYQTKPYTGERCNISVFTRSEQQFLKKCLCLQTFPHLLDSAIKEVVDDDNTSAIIGNCLKGFSIDTENEYVTCQKPEHLQEFIPYVKHLLFLHRPIKDKVDIKLKSAGVDFIRRAYEQPSLLHVRNNEFLDIAGELNNDKDHVKKFLSEQEKKVMHVTVEHEMRSTSAKLYNTFQRNRSASSTCSVLPLRQLLVIDDRFVRLNDFLKEANEHLLIIECEPNTDLDYFAAARELFLSIVSILKEKSNKVIVITCQGDKYNEFFQGDYSKNFIQEEYVTLEDNGINWDELSPDSQQKLLSEKVIFFQGEKTSLEEILGSKNVTSLIPGSANMFDAETTLQLISNKPVTVGSEQLRLRDFSASFAKLYTDIEPDSLCAFLLGQSHEEYIIMIVIDPSIPLQDEAAVMEQFLQRLEKDSTKRRTIQSMINKTIFMYVAKDVEYKSTKWMQLCQTHTNKRIYWLEAAGERISCQQIFDPNLYCKRQFNHREKIVLADGIKQVLSRGTSDDVFIFSGIEDENELARKLRLKNLTSAVNLVRFATTEELAESIFTIASKLDILCHLLKFDTINGKEEIVWMRSHGSLKTIRSNVKNNLISSVDEYSFIRKRDGKVVIFIGEPGMGKSTTLTSLAEQIESGFVIRIDFKDCIHAISRLPSAESNHSIENAVQFLAMVDSAGFNSNLAKRLLQYALEGKMCREMFLLFDGFDEIMETDQRKVASFLKFLQENSSSNIWITTREYPRTMLEDTLCVFATSFTRISREQQQEFLEKFWQVTLSLQRNQISDFEKKIKDYANELLEKAGTILGQEIYSFMGIPLQMRMLAEVFQPNVQTVSDPSNNDFTAKLHDILGLYRSFINSKYEIYFRKTGFPAGSAEVSKLWLREPLTKKHRCLAVELLFPDDVLKLIRAEHSRDAKSNLMELNRVGLIQSTHGDGKYNFIHKSFAEYFVADALASWLKKPHGRHPAFDPLETFLTRILSRPDYKVVRLFLNGLLSSGKSDSEESAFYEERIDRLWFGSKDLYVDDGLQTAFHVLAEENLQNIFHYLVNMFRMDEDKLSALFSTRNQNEETALYVAVKADRSEIVEQILERLKRCKDAFKERVLLASIFRTAEDEESDIVKKLQEYVKDDSAMKTICDQINWTLITRFLDAARDGNFHEMSQMWEESSAFCRYYLLKATDQRKRTALHIASEKGHVKFVQFLIEANVEVNCQDKNEEDLAHFTPLHYAVKFRHEAIVRILLNNNANVNAIDRGGFTPLHHATIGHNVCIGIVTLLLENECCDITIKDKTRMTAFAWAAKCGQLDIIKLLIGKGILQKVDINDVDRNGMTALNHAAKAQKWDVVIYLMDQGADVHKVDANGNSPLSRVIKTGIRDKIVKMLQPSGKMNDVIDDATANMLRQNNIPNLGLDLETDEIPKTLYRVFCSNNVEVLQMMIAKFKDYYKEGILQQVSICASRVFQDMQIVGNVQLSNDMEVAINSLLSV